VKKFLKGKFSGICQDKFKVRLERESSYLISSGGGKKTISLALADQLNFEDLAFLGK